jgi:flavin-dependent dehydrogenase
MQTFDVIIVGAGPAGSTAAYELAKAGIKVLVLEKYTLPRFKCCAGGITFKAAKNLPLDINELAEDTIKVVDARYKNTRYEGSHDLPLLYTILRPKLDHALARKAEAAGALILEGQPVIQLVNNVDHVEVSTGADIYQAKFVIGADGARSLVAREAGLTIK